MAPDRRRIPKSYDEIVRGTVPDPDTSFRPTPHQEGEADERFRVARLRAQMTDQERMLYASVAEALLASRTPRGDIGFEIDGGRVLLHGSVRNAGEISRIESIVASLEGVEEILNRVVVGAPHR